VMGLMLLFGVSPGEMINVAWFYFNVLVITAIITAISELVEAVRRARAVHDASALAEAGGAPRPAGPAGAVLPYTLPARVAEGDILAVQAEDHYLRVHTTTGNALVLGRLADAVRALAGCDGAQVHRSYWVSRGAVAGHAREGQRVTLTLSNGLQVPVSRRHAPVLRRMGWLDGGNPA
jgi:DNA-binding LytR/AlgR family response regulator